MPDEQDDSTLTSFLKPPTWMIWSDGQDGGGGEKRTDEEVTDEEETA